LSLTHHNQRREIEMKRERNVLIGAFILTLLLVMVNHSQITLQEKKDDQGRIVYTEIDMQNGSRDVVETWTEYFTDTPDTRIRRISSRTRDGDKQVRKETSELLDREGNVLERREVRFDRQGRISFGEKQNWVYVDDEKELVEDQVFDVDLKKWLPRQTSSDEEAKSPATSPKNFGGVYLMSNASAYKYPFNLPMGIVDLGNAVRIGHVEEDKETGKWEFVEVDWLGNPANRAYYQLFRVLTTGTIAAGKDRVIDTSFTVTCSESSGSSTMLLPRRYFLRAAGGELISEAATMTCSEGKFEIDSGRWNVELTGTRISDQEPALPDNE